MLVLWSAAGVGARAVLCVPEAVCWRHSYRHLSTSQHLLAKAKRAATRGKQHPPQQSHLQQLVLADTRYIEKQKGEILQLFPNVKSTIKNMFSNLSSNLSRNYRCDEKTSAMGRINHQLVFQCSFSINWPKSVTFTGYGFTKRSAEISAIAKAAEMLYRENYLTADGYPVTASVEERQQHLREWNLPPRISFHPTTLQEGMALLTQFERDVRPVMDQDGDGVSSLPLSDVEQDIEDQEGPIHVPSEVMGEEDSYQRLRDTEDTKKGQGLYSLLTGCELSRQDEDSDYRSSFLHHLLLRRQRNQRQDVHTQKWPTLPMLKYRDQVISALKEGRVLIVSGDTGCGKSTQVPQMILDQWIEEGRGTECNIIVTQPRRISAISLAKRVAKERNEKIGDSIGYHVRLEHRPVRGSGGVLFCTTGMLLQGLHSNPGLAGVSHVVVDEVHERSVQTDILLILLRRLLQQHTSLRLVLMSASLSTEQLLRYFWKDEASLIEVPGTLYPLTRHYLPGALHTLGISPSHHNLRALMETESQPAVNVDLIVHVIRAIDHSKPPGAVLCFLPGWQDISVLQNRLQSDVTLGRRLSVLPLHSRLPTQEQELIFEPPPAGKRKVVLATNLAETSLTVEDVVYVVDTGFHKEHRYNSKRDISVLGNHWISRANSQQRAGRAGRVQAGEVFHLYSSQVHKDMHQFPVPEIMRIPLEHVILQCKAHCGDENAFNFLSEGICVPSRRLVSTAVMTLERLGMLTSDPQEAIETLTPLGHRVTHFSTSPHFSKALVFASVFRCVDPVLTISAALTGGRGIFHNTIDLRARTREVKMEVDSTSDLLAIHELHKEWKALGFYEDQLNFCNENNLSYRGLRFNEGIKQVHSRHLYDAKLLDSEYVSSEFSSWNTNSTNSQLVLGMLVAGGGKVLRYQRGSYSKGILNPDSLSIKSQEGEHIETGSDCVLHQPPRSSSLPPHLLCMNLSRDGVSRRTVARDLSLLQPLTVALFSGESLLPSDTPEGYKCVSVDGRERCSFLVENRAQQFLLHLRETINQTVSFLIRTRGFAAAPPSVSDFCQSLVAYVSKLLKEDEEEGGFKEREVGRKRSRLDIRDYPMLKDGEYGRNV